MYWFYFDNLTELNVVSEWFARTLGQYDLASKEARHFFLANDKNADGFVTKAEAKEKFESYGFKWNKACDKAFEALDSIETKDGRVSIREFMKHVLETQ